MSTQIAKIDKYKIAYWNPRTSTVMHSKMVPTYQAAQKVANKVSKNGFMYTIMESTNVTGTGYTWKVLDDGAGQWLPIASKAWEHRKPIGYGLVGIMLFRLIFK
jgi:hypothetical protein